MAPHAVCLRCSTPRHRGLLGLGRSFGQEEGWVGGSGLLLRGGGEGEGSTPPPPSGGAEILETPKKIFGLNYLPPKAAEKIVDWPKAWKKIWPNRLRVGVGSAGGGGRGGGAETTPARAPAAAADRTQRPDATCEGENG